MKNGRSTLDSGRFQRAMYGAAEPAADGQDRAADGNDRAVDRAADRAADRAPCHARANPGHCQHRGDRQGQVGRRHTT
eukprot:364364-Chlamydomonas_euryale.AAC.5